MFTVGINIDDNVINFMELYSEEIIKQLSSIYNFNQLEAMKRLNINLNISNNNIYNKKNDKKDTKNNSLKKSKIPLPFLGDICKDNCHAIKLNYGLYTQCNNNFKTIHNGKQLCMTCLNQIQKNNDPNPKYGYIQERIEKGVNFKDSNGKTPVSYGNIMEKLNISKNDVLNVCADLGITIPEEQFIVNKTTRGRPKKDTSAIDTSSEEGESVKKGRGRPPKEKKEVKNIYENLTNDNLLNNKISILHDKLELSNLQKEVINNKDKVIDNDSDEDNDSEEELTVFEFHFDNQKYLKSEDNTLYDFNTHEEIGEWDMVNKKINFI